MATVQTWKLKRYGRFLSRSSETRGNTWKVFEAKDNKPEVVLTILQSGYLLVMQGQKSLDTIFLLCGLDSLKVHRDSDSLMFRLTVKGESRMMRMQFDGSSRAEARNKCSSVAEKLKEYIPITSMDDQPPTEVPAPATQTFQEMTVENEPEVVQGSLSVKHLIKFYLGETAINLPQMYHHSSLPQGDLEPFLRVCLLDPSFHVFVARVEGELKKMLQE